MPEQLSAAQMLGFWGLVVSIICIGILIADSIHHARRALDEADDTIRRGDLR